jgi:hypothetical protein
MSFFPHSFLSFTFDHSGKYRQQQTENMGRALYTLFERFLRDRVQTDITSKHNEYVTQTG